MRVVGIGAIARGLAGCFTNFTNTSCEPWLLAAFVQPIFLPGVDFVSGDHRVDDEVRPGNDASSGTQNCGTWHRTRP